MGGDATVRVWTSTAVLVALGVAALAFLGVSMADGLWVLTFAGLFAGSHLVSLVLFDDGTV
jgi:hypothetical protein